MSYVTLISDFGLQDASVAVAKGILLQYLPNIKLVDISHDLIPFFPPQAVYILNSSYRNFPPKTCHLLLADIFYTPSPQLLLIEKEGHYIISPANEIAGTFTENGSTGTWQYSTPSADTDLFTAWLRQAAILIRHIQNEPVSTLDLVAFNFDTYSEQVQFDVAASVACSAIHIDRYENVVTDFTVQRHMLYQYKPFVLQFMEVEEIHGTSNTYTDVKPGYKLCRFNSNGHLEICVNRGRAASLFGLKLNSAHNKIKIIFNDNEDSKNGFFKG